MSNESSERPFEQAKRILQEQVLRNYPNPERRGCPGDTILRRLALPGLPADDDPAWEHVTHCSPCYAEFLQFRAEVKASERRARRHWRLGLVLAALVVAIVCIILVVRVLTFTPPFEELAGEAIRHGSGNLTSATWVGVLDDRTPAQRGPESRQSAEAVLTRSTKEILILLPVNSATGSYDLQIRDGTSLKTVIAHYQGRTSEHDGFPQILRAEVDLSRIPKGPYVVAWERIGSAFWDYDSLRIE